jgi:hypothetical protein
MVRLLGREMTKQTVLPKLITDYVFSPQTEISPETAPKRDLREGTIKVMHFTDIHVDEKYFTVSHMIVVLFVSICLFTSLV